MKSPALVFTDFVCACFAFGCKSLLPLKFLLFGFARRAFDAKKKNTMNKRDNNKYTFKTIMDHIEKKMLTFNFFNQGNITLLMLVSQCGLHIQ